VLQIAFLVATGNNRQQQRIRPMWRAFEMSVQHRIFASSTKAWEALCAEASAFASEIGREKLINISVAASGGTEWFGRGGSGVIVVWYWE
jgi:hypothetical protein